MNGELNSVLNSSDCLSHEQLALYIQNKLSAAEKHKAEKHLLDCELCSDALEGLRLMNSININAAVLEINNNIDQRILEEKNTGPEKKIFLMHPLLRIAAVILLIAASAGTFFYLQKEQKQQEKIVAE